MKTTQPLTDKLVQNISTDRLRLQITDAKTTGLKLRVSRSGHKSFALMIRTSGGKYETYTIGSYPNISLKQARETALKIRVGLKSCCDFKSSATPAHIPEKITLRQILDEVQPIFASTKKSWRLRGGPSSSAYTRNTIERVFSRLLDKSIETLTAEDFGYEANNYKPVRPLKGKNTANGQVSRALSYLSPVLDWAGHRGQKYGKIGAGRPARLITPELRRIHDPATDDPTIRGKRERVLSVPELKAILPLLRYPAPQTIRRTNILPKNDYGPIAMRFLLLTLARRDEVASAKWRDIDFVNEVWIKHNVKDTSGKGRSQRLPLSISAVNLLKKLPGYSNGNAESFVFPNRNGGKIDNWNRIAEQVMKGSGTEGWTRHDLRRTGATLLEELQVPIQTIEAILDHSNRFANAGVSGSAGHYMIATRILNDREDPKVVALNKLSAAIDCICAAP